MVAAQQGYRAWSRSRRRTAIVFLSGAHATETRCARSRSQQIVSATLITDPRQAVPLQLTAKATDTFYSLPLITAPALVATLPHPDRVSSAESPTVARHRTPPLDWSRRVSSAAHSDQPHPNDLGGCSTSPCVPYPSSEWDRVLGPSAESN